MPMRIKKNDTVYVRAGKDRGRTGRVLRVLPAEDKALVEGLNMVRSHQRQRGQGKPGGIVSKEALIPMCRLMLVDPKTNEPGRMRVKTNEDGSRVRVHAKTGNEI